MFTFHWRRDGKPLKIYTRGKHITYIVVIRFSLFWVNDSCSNTYRFDTSPKTILIFLNSNENYYYYQHGGTPNFLTSIITISTEFINNNNNMLPKRNIQNVYINKCKYKCKCRHCIVEWKLLISISQTHLILEYYYVSTNNFCW